MVVKYKYHEKSDFYTIEFAADGWVSSGYSSLEWYFTLLLMRDSNPEEKNCKKLI